MQHANTKQMESNATLLYSSWDKTKKEDKASRSFIHLLHYYKQNTKQLTKHSVEQTHCSAYTVEPSGNLMPEENT